MTGSFLAIPIAAAAGGFTSVAFHEIAKAVHLSETDKAIVEAALLAGSLGVCAGGAAFLPKGVKMADLGVARVASPFNKLVGNRFAGTVKGMKVGGGIGAIGGAAGAWFAERRRQAFGH